MPTSRTSTRKARTQSPTPTRSDDPHYWFDGRIAEIAVFDRELTDGELEAVEEYMSTKHNIALNGPVE